MKFKENVEKELKRTQNMLERSRTANNLRDQVSRAYYACYHAMLAALWLSGEDLGISKYKTSHVDAMTRYKIRYSRTKKNNISLERDVYNSAREWINLRNAADYDIFTDDYEHFKEEITKNKLRHMYKFVDEHIKYIENKLNSKDLSVSGINSF